MEISRRREGEKGKKGTRKTIERAIKDATLNIITRDNFDSKDILVNQNCEKEILAVPNWSRIRITYVKG